MPREAQSPLPVAPMIRSCWSCQKQGAVERSLNVEILMVGRTDGKGPLLLAVRRVPCDPGSDGSMPWVPPPFLPMVAQLGTDQLLSASADQLGPEQTSTSEGGYQQHLQQLHQHEIEPQRQVARSQGTFASSVASTVTGNHVGAAWSEHSLEQQTPPPTLYGLSTGNQGARVITPLTDRNTGINANVTGLLEEVTVMLQHHGTAALGTEQSFA
mmetsp:Transcript_9441/g.18078  ORF Transcript_9441/g.18078 Transcript_9441/m.18078 type:complete len:213 (-) Transcript_9441:64-702(-)